MSLFYVLMIEAKHRFSGHVHSLKFNDIKKLLLLSLFYAVVNIYDFYLEIVTQSTRSCCLKVLV